MRFVDRRQAGERLAEVLRARRWNHPFVLALPRGGVPVAAEVARALKAPLDLWIVRKIGAPKQPELAIGAIAEGGVTLYDDWTIRQVNASAEAVAEQAECARRELVERLGQFRPDGRLPSLSGRDVIVVDDGIATGLTVRAACQAIRERGAERVVVAAPVGSPRACDELRSACDELITLAAPSSFFAVGQFYEDFAPVGAREVEAVLERFGRSPALAPAIAEPGIDESAPADPTHTAAENRGVRNGRRRSRALPEEVVVRGYGFELPGTLTIPRAALGTVIFAHGSGSSRASPRNRAVAARLNERGLATLVFDLLTEKEASDRNNVFDVPFLALRLVMASRWAQKQVRLKKLPIGYFGTSTGAAAALWAAADLGKDIAAVVSRGGRVDLATRRLPGVEAPTLLIVGERDPAVLTLNREALPKLRVAELTLIAGAGHLFEEPGALERVADHAGAWFIDHFERRKTHAAA